MKGPKPRPILERIMAKVIRVGKCLFWTGATNGHGYGVILAEGQPRRMIYVHRAIFEAINGPIINNKVLDHLCRNRNCCNIEHLEAVTHRENLFRGEAPNWKTTRTKICKRGHYIDGKNVQQATDGRFRCRICTIQRKRWRRKYNIPLPDSLMVAP